MFRLTNILWHKGEFDIGGNYVKRYISIGYLKSIIDTMNFQKLLGRNLF